MLYQPSSCSCEQETKSGNIFLGKELISNESILMWYYLINHLLMLIQWKAKNKLWQSYTICPISTNEKRSSLHQDNNGVTPKICKISDLKTITVTIEPVCICLNLDGRFK